MTPDPFPIRKGDVIRRCDQHNTVSGAVTPLSHSVLQHCPKWCTSLQQTRFTAQTQQSKLNDTYHPQTAHACRFNGEAMCTQQDEVKNAYCRQAGNRGGELDNTR